MANDTNVPSSPLIDDEHAAFVTAGVSISVGSRNAEHFPNLTRGIGCRVDDGRARLAVFVVAEQSRELLDDIRANGHVAVVFSQPSTHRTVQLKGVDGEIETLLAGDRQRIERYRQAFTDELGTLGYGSLFVQALIDGSGGEIVAVCFTPSAAFQQTPGPLAGRPLGEAR